jgi:hypothetical protein
MRWALVAFALSAVSAPALAQSPYDLKAAAFAREGEALTLASAFGRAGESRGFDVNLNRSFQGFSVETERLEFDVSPHAGFGVSPRGGQAQAGATVSLTPRTDATVERLRDLGIREGASFGDTGRWYLFAAASGRAVGMNVLRGEGGGWDRAGWSTDPTGALVGDAQVGVGWRKGHVQSSFGVIHREVRGNHMIFGQQTREDTVAAFSFSVRPQK